MGPALGTPTWQFKMHQAMRTYAVPSAFPFLRNKRLDPDIHRREGQLQDGTLPSLHSKSLKPQIGIFLHDLGGGLHS